MNEKPPTERDEWAHMQPAEDDELCGDCGERWDLCECDQYEVTGITTYGADGIPSGFAMTLDELTQAIAGARTMDPFSPPGTRVVFAYPNNGYPGEAAEAKASLTIGQAYTIERTFVGGSYTSVWLKEFPQRPFNSVHFETIDRAIEGER